MITLITILIVISCLILGFFVLIQNPKGGGLTGAFGTMSSQVMGVKQSGDVMEKGTWTMISIVAGLCIVSVLFIQHPNGNQDNGKNAQKQNTTQKKK